MDFSTVMLLNFEHVDELHQSGKRFPMSGFLQSYEFEDEESASAGLIFLTDDSILVRVPFQPDDP
jgi:hypothetical protein